MTEEDGKQSKGGHKGDRSYARVKIKYYILYIYVRLGYLK